MSAPPPYEPPPYDPNVAPGMVAPSYDPYAAPAYDPNVAPAFDPNLGYGPAPVQPMMMQGQPQPQPHQSFVMQPAGPPVVVQQPMMNSVQAEPQTIVVTSGRNYDSDDFMVTLFIFLFGWLCCCVWLGGFGFIKSEDDRAKGLSWMSIGMYFCASVFFLTLIVVSASG